MKSGQTMRLLFFLAFVFSPMSIIAAPLSPQQEKDKLDTRIPLPLSPSLANKQLANMRELFDHLQLLVEGMSKDDFTIIEKGASRFTSNPQRIKGAKEMGRGDKVFVEMGLLFLESGDNLMSAVKKKDMKLINQKFSEFLSHCSSCHDAYKQHVILEADFLNIKQAFLNKAESKKLQKYVLQTYRVR